MKIRIIMLGKTRCQEIRALLDDYIGRIEHFARIEVSELREASSAAVRKLRIGLTSLPETARALGHSLKRRNHLAPPRCIAQEHS